MNKQYSRKCSLPFFNKRLLLALAGFLCASTANAAIVLKETNWNTFGNMPTIDANFYVAQQAGDLNVVIIGWNDTTSSVVSVTDSRGNAYVKALGPTVSAGNASQSIYYAKNVVASSTPNTVTVTFNNSSVPNVDLRMMQYSGVDTVNPLDGAVGASGNGTAMNSGSVTTTNANDLLVASNYIEFNFTAIGSGFTQRDLTDMNHFIADKIVTSAGSQSATATQDTSGYWILQMVAFKAAGSGGDTTPPSPPTGLATTSTTATSINLSWTASSDPSGISNYEVERCQGASCSDFGNLATPTTNALSVTGLAPNTVYRFRVRAKDGAGNVSGNSAIFNASTAADTQNPTAPTTFSATAASPVQVNLSWSGAGDNVGVTSYEIQWCSGSGCTPATTISGVTGTTYNHTGRTPATIYRYRVQARDAANNPSGYTATFSATTPADSSNPTPPTTFSATAASATQINLTWSGATDNVGVTSYDIQWCNTGSTCTPATVISGVTGTTYNHTGRAPSTLHRYRVQARDAANNPSGYTAIFSATTQADTTAPSIPGSFAATVVSSSQINLSWTASTDNVGVVSYTLQWCTGSGCTPSTSITVTGLSHNHTGLSASTIYRYRVRANDAAGNGPTNFTSIIQATTQAANTPPTVPGSFTATPVSSSQINLSWAASTDNSGVAPTYEVIFCTGSGCTPGGTPIAVTGTSYNHTGLSASTLYRYQVRAVDNQGLGGAYTAVVGATTNTAPLAPTGLIETAKSNKEIDIAWTASASSGVTGYIVERCQGNGCSSFAQVGTASLNLYYYDTAVSQLTSYTYRVRALVGSNQSSPSTGLTIVTLSNAACD